MPLGIKPTVDFAFKKIFGSPENSAVLICLLNAILDGESPVKEVEIQNPFSYQEFLDQKRIVLDIKARDASGRGFNIEMQVANHSGLMQRLTYYACEFYTEQLKKGEDYFRLQPAVSICLLNDKLFLDTHQAHHRFQMVDVSSGRVFSEGIEVHSVELPKYDLTESTISDASALDQWVFFLLYADDYDADELAKLLPGIEFQQAIRVVQTISEKTEDKVMYDQREKAQRDYEWGLASERMKGLEKGHEKGLLGGAIQTLQKILGMEITPAAELRTMPDDELETLLGRLEQQAMNRDN